MIFRHRRRVVPVVTIDGRAFTGSLAWRQFVSAGWAMNPADARDPVDQYHLARIAAAFDRIWAWWCRLSPSARFALSGIRGEPDNRAILSRRRWRKPIVTRKIRRCVA